MLAKLSSALSVLHREATVISSRYKAGIVNHLPKTMNDFVCSKSQKLVNSQIIFSH